MLLPVAIVIVVSGMRRSLMEIHHGLLALIAGRLLSTLITDLLKSRVGRLRPDFLSRCKWDAALSACTGKADDVLDGRKSFPSGHSSTAFAGMTFLFLWIAGNTSAWSFTSRPPSSLLLRSRLLGLLISLLPIGYATWVAISRMEDYRHHKEDVIVGSLVGILSSTICYLVYWPNPFSWRSFKDSLLGKPRILYSGRDDRRRPGDFALTSLDDDDQV
ncbi:phosphatidic acid phosphatase [Punctularia strigosozonata HHB-11173 SS5]|uniref:phosphatidic acid phosphatase n=1 Tax=Punctularia strigosozonata (strain HHB-11173) TaxID=741275 RepID=UPI0004417A51|nr:phosphatidic acid phosphatase [Punctularia strigosozonata HHB-11173 SS5]EIN09506.1 phosphatidic acid phosphatase [Punctularia strigosozonata HHB-11173 SS5]